MLEPITQFRGEPLDPPTPRPVADASPVFQEHPPEDPLRQAISYLDTAGKTLHPGHPDEADRILSLLRMAAAHLEIALASQNGLRLGSTFHGAE